MSTEFSGIGFRFSFSSVERGAEKGGRIELFVLV